MIPPSKPSQSRPVRVAIGLALRPTTHRSTSGGEAEGVEVLITQRPSHTVYGGYWEFPGGKIHDGESPAQCLVREFLEEVALHIEPTRELPGVEHIYDHAHVYLYPFECRVIPMPGAGVADQVRHLQVADHRWIAPVALRQYVFPEANASLVEHLIAEYGGKN